jgi:hypothetical protein
MQIKKENLLVITVYAGICRFFENLTFKISHKLVIALLAVIIIYFSTGFALIASLLFLSEIGLGEWEALTSLYLLSFVPPVLSLVLFLLCRRLNTFEIEEIAILVIFSAISMSFGISSSFSWMKGEATRVLEYFIGSVFLNVVIWPMIIAFPLFIPPYMVSSLVSFLVARNLKSQKSRLLVGLILFISLTSSMSYFIGLLYFR